MSQHSSFHIKFVNRAMCGLAPPISIGCPVLPLTPVVRFKLVESVLYTIPIFFVLLLVLRMVELCALVHE